MMSAALQKGFALVLVLWVLSLLTIMAGSFALSMRRESAIIEGVKHNAETQSIAESGLAIAQLMLLNSDPKNRWRADGSVYEIDFNNAKVRIRLISETGKIDINTASQKVLTGLMAQAPVETEQQDKLLNAILDWRDADDDVREHGAEKAQYKQAKLSYGPRNKRFHSIEELQMILGMDNKVFAWLVPRITTFSGQELDLKLATKEVLQVLPEIDTSQIDKYIAIRHQNAIDGLPIPEFPLLGQAVTDKAEDVETTVDAQSEPAASDGAQDQEVETGVVEMIAEVQVADSVNALLSIVVEKTDTGVGSPFKVLKWRRNFASDVSLFSDDMSEYLVGQYAEPQFDN